MKKVAGTILTQGTMAFVALITGILLPKYMGPTQYGYWQIYVFYLAYINIAGMGFNDGLTLIYSGTAIDTLQQAKLRTSIRLVLLQSLIFSGVLLFYTSFIEDYNKQWIFFALIFNIVIVVIFCICQGFFLAINNIPMYNLSNLIYKVLPSFIFLCLLFRGEISFKNFMLIDYIVRLVVTAAMLIICRKYFLGKGVGLFDGIRHVKYIITSGFTVMLTVFISGLWLGAGRMIVQYAQSIEIYGVYSFAVSLLSIILTFSSAIGIVFFPTIKCMDINARIANYFKYKFLIEYILCFSFFVFSPIVFVLKIYMPLYASAADYIAFLLVACLPLGVMQMLVFSYYKAFRLEKSLLYISLGGFILISVTSLIAYILFPSVNSIAISTMIAMYIIYIIADRYLQIKMCQMINTKKEAQYKITFTWPAIAFLLCTYTGSPSVFCVAYAVVFLLYTIQNRKKIKGWLIQLKM